MKHPGLSPDENDVYHCLCGKTYLQKKAFYIHTETCEEFLQLEEEDLDLGVKINKKENSKKLGLSPDKNGVYYCFCGRTFLLEKNFYIHLETCEEFNAIQAHLQLEEKDHNLGVEVTSDIEESTQKNITLERKTKKEKKISNEIDESLNQEKVFREDHEEKILDFKFLLESILVPDKNGIFHCLCQNTFLGGGSLLHHISECSFCLEVLELNSNQELREIYQIIRIDYDKLNLGPTLLEKQLENLAVRHGSDNFLCLCGKTYKNQGSFIRHSKNCIDCIKDINFQGFIKKKKRLLNTKIKKKNNIKTMSPPDIYLDDSELDNVDNDILYYINKHNCLSTKEIEYFLKMDNPIINSHLKSLYLKAYISKQRFKKSYLYYIGDNKEILKRKERIKSYIDRFTDENFKPDIIKHILNKEKICLDDDFMNECLQEMNYELNNEKYIKKKHDTDFKINLRKACSRIEFYKQELELSSDIVEYSILIYNHTLRKKFDLARDIDLLLAASIYCAIRAKGKTRSIYDVLDVILVPLKGVMNILRVMITDILPDLDLSIKEINYYDYINNLVLKLNLSTTCGEISRSLLDNAIKNGFNTDGKDPKGIAAALIYLGAKKTNESRIQLKIAKAGKTTEVTLRSRVKDLQNFI